LAFDEVLAAAHRLPGTFWEAGFRWVKNAF